MIPRFVENNVYEKLTTLHKVIILLGARQVGKTTLLKSLQTRIERQGKTVRYLNCDLEEERQALNTTSYTLLSRLVTGKDALFVDEAQRLDNPGLTLKILIDQFPGVMLLVTGSSSFELRNRMSDALTGRYIDYILPPLSLGEVLQASKDGSDPALRKPVADAMLPGILRYGLYPEIFLETGQVLQQLLLSKLVESYLFKDILSFQNIRYSQTIVDLARALAYQIGNEVSENELANRLKIDRKTVHHYIDILEKSFVIFRLPAYSKNPRREIGRLSKLYFFDLGIRNALIGDYNDLSIRADQGSLWENFLIAERIKKYLNQGSSVNARFWRTYSGSEVDYIEETLPGQMQAFELKLGGARLRKGAESFKQAYQVNVQLINQENYLDFIL